MDKLSQHWKASANRDYLGSWDLQTGTSPNGKPVYGELTVTISDVKLDEKVVDMEKGGNAKKECSVIRFKENLKPMILNSTNKKAISTSTGSPVPKFWIGKQITIYVESGIYLPGTKRADNITTDGLRVRPYPYVPQKTYKCADCGAETDETTKVRTTKMFGKCLCKNCGNKAYAEQKVAQETATEQVTETVEDMADVPS